MLVGEGGHVRVVMKMLSWDARTAEGEGGWKRTAKVTWAEEDGGVDGGGHGGRGDEDIDDEDKSVDDLFSWADR